ncbi:cu/Zn superoxide dismutase [Geopyxis carbonaria]|nr:cu/Zn superoxide dismutase [Geopyxis carbonaria]
MQLQSLLLLLTAASATTAYSVAPAPEVLTPVPAGVPEGWIGPAARSTRNPPGAVYAAKLTGAVTGTITLSSGRHGRGVNVAVDLSSLPPSASGPWGYHIHDQPIPAGGSCADTKAHLDPYRRGQATPCDAADPASCEVGDLAGKHGKIAIPVEKKGRGYGYGSKKRGGFKQEYTDKYVSLKFGEASFAGNRSVVIHANDEKKTRLACANFQVVKKRGYGY